MGDMPIIRTGHCGPHGTFFGAACPLCAMAISGVDPRDARIAELEAALAGLVDSDGPDGWDAAEHLAARKAAERALGRRK